MTVPVQSVHTLVASGKVCVAVHSMHSLFVTVPIQSVHVLVLGKVCFVVQGTHTLFVTVPVHSAQAAISEV